MTGGDVTKKMLVVSFGDARARPGVRKNNASWRNYVFLLSAMWTKARRGKWQTRAPGAGRIPRYDESGMKGRVGGWRERR